MFSYGVKLVPVNYVKYLGMYIDKYLSWSYHITQLSKKFSRANGIISKLRHCAPQEICIQAYYAMFYSHLNYGCNIWGLTSEENLKKIEILQRKCLRILTFSDFRAHANPLFINLRMLKIRDIIKFNQLKLNYDFLNNSLPADLNKLFKLNTDIHTHDTRQLFHVPSINTSTYGRYSIKYVCPSLWNTTFKNDIPIGNNRIISLSNIKNTYQFKKTLKRHFLFNYSLEEYA